MIFEVVNVIHMWNIRDIYQHPKEWMFIFFLGLDFAVLSHKSLMSTFFICGHPILQEVSLI